MRQLDSCKSSKSGSDAAARERLLLASAHTFLLSPDLLGDLGVVSPEGLDRYGWPSLAILAGRTLRDLAVLRETHGDEVPALNLPTRVPFGSSAASQGFVDELSDEIGRLLAKYHDETAPVADHWFFLGAYRFPIPSRELLRRRLHRESTEADGHGPARQDTGRAPASRREQELLAVV